MGHRWMPAAIALAAILGAVTLAGCRTHEEALHDPCPAVSNHDQPADPKVGSTGDQVQSQQDCNSDADHAEGQVCAAAAELKASLTDLRNSNVLETGTSGLQANVDAVKDDVRSLANSAGDTIRPSVDALRSALGDLETAIRNVVANGVSPVQAAAQRTSDAAAQLQAHLAALRCNV